MLAQQLAGMFGQFWQSVRFVRSMVGTDISNRDDHPCGAKDPTRVNTTSLSPTATSGSGSGSSDASATALDTFGGSGSSGSKSNAGITTSSVNMYFAYGISIACGAVLTGMGLAM